MSESISKCQIKQSNWAKWITTTMEKHFALSGPMLNQVYTPPPASIFFSFFELFGFLLIFRRFRKAWTNKFLPNPPRKQSQWVPGASLNAPSRHFMIFASIWVSFWETFFIIFSIFSKRRKSWNYSKTNRKTTILPFQSLHFSINFWPKIDVVF